MRHPPDPPDVVSSIIELLPDVIEWMRRRGHQYADCNDLATKVVQEATNIADRYDPEKGAVKTWVYGIAIVVSRNHWEKLERYQGTFLPDLGDIEREPAPGASPEDQTAGHEVLRFALGLLRARMNAKFYEVFLAHIDGLNEGEIAQAFGISKHTVKSRLSRARAQAREILQGHEHELRTVLPLFFGSSELRFEGGATSTHPGPAAPHSCPAASPPRLVRLAKKRRRLTYMLLGVPALGLPVVAYELGRMESSVLLSAVSSPPKIEVIVGSGAAAASLVEPEPEQEPERPPPPCRRDEPVYASRPRALLFEIERALAGQQEDAARSAFGRYLASYPADPLHVKPRYDWLLAR
ncbi:RNA polymerase sigma factor [Polyangium aurulentum]|uniref:RNA polymerase sigma factor n=1 Tax=Polyangium aurulentum TaxID=2567896 RepID=UPI0010ADB55F|nr:sigma-70 family RNA polymerase sigma factor [Polyangium aurulentum]UQA59970.1 sigma-70 family RNA polymerase sigma factor [Polyangium aurulentum]